jgi:hypothetical protein
MTNTELALLPTDNLASISGGRGSTPAPHPTPAPRSGSSSRSGTSTTSSAPSGSGINVNVGGNIRANVTGDLNRAIDQIGAGGQRLLGCATGANSRQEFGRCILTGHLDGQH